MVREVLFHLLYPAFHLAQSSLFRLLGQLDQLVLVHPPVRHCLVCQPDREVLGFLVCLLLLAHRVCLVVPAVLWVRFHRESPECQASRLVLKQIFIAHLNFGHHLEQNFFCRLKPFLMKDVVGFSTW